MALRLRMLECAQKEGISEASRRFGVSRPTLYKLLARYQEKGPEGLLNRPHGGSYRNIGYGVRAEYIGDDIWVHLVDSKVVITHAGKTIAEHSLTV